MVMPPSGLPCGKRHAIGVPDDIAAGTGSAVQGLGNLREAMAKGSQDPVNRQCAAHMLVVRSSNSYIGERRSHPIQCQCRDGPG